MTEQFIPHPPSPPEKKDTVTLNKKNLTIFGLIAAISVLVIALIISNKGSDSSSSSTTDTTVSSISNTPVTAPAQNKYDQYINHVLNQSGKANTWTDANLIEFGDLVCQSLDNGSSIRQVVDILGRNVRNDSDVVFFASVVRGADRKSVV